MLEIQEMPPEELPLLLSVIGYGHLGCARADARPYVVPIHYAYEEPDIYIFTTEGLKTEYMDANPEVCLQVEDVRDPAYWRSVVVNGRAERLNRPEETEHAMQLITKRNPTLTPAISELWIDSWGRANVVAIYRIRPHMMSGRKTV